MIGKMWLSILLLVCCVANALALDPHIFSKNNVMLDEHFILNDFYLYPSSENYNRFYARITNIGPKDFEFVKLHVYLFKNETLVKTDYTYIDYPTLGSSGVTSLSETYTSGLIEVADFDSASFFINHSMADITAPRLNKDALVVSNPLAELSSTLFKMSGLITNTSDIIIKFPQIFALVYKNGNVVTFDYGYADVSEYQIMPLATAPWDFLIDLPTEYDSLVYKTNYSITQTGSVYVPVELISFKGDFYDNAIKLAWFTATESNNFGFSIEKKIDNNWQEIAFISGHSTTANKNSYSYMDRNISPGQNCQYRLKQMDYSGFYEYSSIIIITAGIIPTQFTVGQNYPNPFNETTTIPYSILREDNYQFYIYNQTGQLVKTVLNHSLSPGEYSINVNMAGMPTGCYFYRLQSKTENSQNKMIYAK
jgi:hypothetical protein